MCQMALWMSVLLTTLALVTGPPYIRFYCGVPLVTHDHVRLGALCLVGTQPRTLRPEQLQVLINLAELSVRELQRKDTAKKLQKPTLIEKHPRVPKLDRRLPTLKRVQAVRESWFQGGLHEGSLLIDISGGNTWNVRWSDHQWVGRGQFLFQDFLTHAPRGALRARWHFG